MFVWVGVGVNVWVGVGVDVWVGAGGEGKLTSAYQIAAPIPAPSILHKIQNMSISFQ